MLQICDFGLAKWKQQVATQTSEGKRRGTVAYMAPEVFKDVSCPRTVRYDVYSFGILLWELLSEKTPFEDGTDTYVCWNNSDFNNTFCDKLESVHLFIVYFKQVALLSHRGCTMLHVSQ